jgi:hypothetical protein
VLQPPLAQTLAARAAPAPTTPNPLKRGFLSSDGAPTSPTWRATLADVARRARTLVRDLDCNKALGSSYRCPGAARAVCGKEANYVVDGKPVERFCKPHAPDGAVHAVNPCAACGKDGGYVFDGEHWCSEHAPDGAFHAYRPCAVCGKEANYVGGGKPGKRFCKPHAPDGAVHAYRPCAAGAACGKQGTYVFDGEPGEYLCSEHAPAVALATGAAVECAGCQRAYPGGRSRLCGACRPPVERKARSPRAEEVALQALREAFPAGEGWVLTHNRGGIGGQNDNVCRVVGAGAAEELTNRRYRVDFVLWNRRNPSRIALAALDEHQSTAARPTPAMTRTRR